MTFLFQSEVLRWTIRCSKQGFPSIGQSRSLPLYPFSNDEPLHVAGDRPIRLFLPDHTLPLCATIRWTAKLASRLSFSFFLLTSGLHLPVDSSTSVFSLSSPFFMVNALKLLSDAAFPLSD